MWIFGVAGLGELEHHGIALGRQPTLACRSGDHRDLVVGVVEEVLQLVLGERSLGWRLFVVLYVRGRVPLEEDLGRVGAESLLAHTVLAIVGMADVGAEHPQLVLITADRRLPAARHRAQVTEELLDHRRGPRSTEIRWYTPGTARLAGFARQ